MRKPFETLVVSLALVGITPMDAEAASLTDGMKEGAPTFKSAGPLAFGPEGMLFVADTKAATITAIATGDVSAGAASKPLKVEGIDQKIAALLGVTGDQILINDMVVSPLSRNTYLAVSRGRGTDATPVIIKVNVEGRVEVAAFEKVKFSRAELPDAPVDGVVGTGNRQSNPRQETITDIAFLEDRVVVAGLSNEEFSSTLRAIPFPFKAVQNGTSVEMYHGAHGRFETRSPIRTFVPLKVGNELQLLAAYTCTPLVQFSVADLKPGAKIKGKTVAELGNRNRPLDMIVYQREGKDFLLLANSSRGLMKISTDHIESTENISTPVPDGAKKGLPYETIANWTGIEQLDRFDSKQALVVRRGEGGALSLESLALP